MFPGTAIDLWKVVEHKKDFGERIILAKTILSTIFLKHMSSSERLIKQLKIRSVF